MLEVVVGHEGGRPEPCRVKRFLPASPFLTPLNAYPATKGT